MEEYPNLTIPMIIFLVTCVLTMIFAVLATRPTITTGTFTKDDIKANAPIFYSLEIFTE